jgi:hypothetical protein
MTPDRDISADLEGGTTDDVIRLAERLERERPVPSAAFRGELRRRMLTGARPPRSRPARLRVSITAYASAGSLLLVVGAISAAGVGPLGA